MRSSFTAAADGLGDPNSTMTVEEALQVSWLSYKPRPLGELMDEGYLDKSRLEWAAQKAYNPLLKKAAAVLLSEKGNLNAWSRLRLAKRFRNSLLEMSASAWLKPRPPDGPSEIIKAKLWARWFGRVRSH